MSKPSASRRTVLAGLVAAAAGAPLLDTLTAAPAHAADLYASNTALYANAVEGVDFGRRFKRHELLDSSMTTNARPRLSSILAIHGGNIERGTSELCLGIAGYHPATLAPVDKSAPLYDYWMLEGLLSKDNVQLHVTAENNDDPVARSIAAASANVISVHGCTTDSAKLPAGTKAVIVGGAGRRLREALAVRLDRAGFTIADTSPDKINGDAPGNICNRTLTDEGGAQLELTSELRESLFDDFGNAPDVNSPTLRSQNTNTRYWAFVNACRAALAEVEKAQLDGPSIWHVPTPA
ncbi:poly-gamma-glutamate hydrolase family protein [Streptomyces sp. cg36]|uniref:poly-gamma-glutamate hydrolase family protein n=1 Tax=Streptomyces sp. cg36 TaxID=3238798 RepID=UPI0034E2DC27